MYNIQGICMFIYHKKNNLLLHRLKNRKPSLFLVRFFSPTQEIFISDCKRKRIQVKTIVDLQGTQIYVINNIKMATLVTQNKNN